VSTATINLLYTEIEDDLRSTVRDLLADRCDVTAVRAMYDGDRSVVAPLWKGLASELGLAGLLVPESLGGAGATASEAAVVLEELGRACAPVPFLTSSVIATTALLGSSSGLLGELASGSRTAAVVVPWSTSPYGEVPLADGQVRNVAGAVEADVLLVPTSSGLRVVDAADATIEPVVSLDMTRQVADVTVSADAGEVVADVADVKRALLVGAGLLASEQLGLAQWGFTTTLEYSKVRHQFGRQIGSYQAIKHRLADLYVGVEQATAAVRQAAGALAADDDVDVSVAVAASYAGETAVRTAEETIQLHGGIGMTWEHPAHLYLKRAKADQIALGTPGAHRARLAEVVGLTL